jgi:hypothetical protein
MNRFQKASQTSIVRAGFARSHAEKLFLEQHGVLFVDEAER